MRIDTAALDAMDSRKEEWDGQSEGVDRFDYAGQFRVLQKRRDAAEKAKKKAQRLQRETLKEWNSWREGKEIQLFTVPENGYVDPLWENRQTREGFLAKEAIDSANMLVVLRDVTSAGQQGIDEEWGHRNLNEKCDIVIGNKVGDMKSGKDQHSEMVDIQVNVVRPLQDKHGIVDVRLVIKAGTNLCVTYKIKRKGEGKMPQFDKYYRNPTHEYNLYVIKPANDVAGLRLPTTVLGQLSMEDFVGEEEDGEEIQIIPSNEFMRQLMDERALSRSSIERYNGKIQGRLDDRFWTVVSFLTTGSDTRFMRSVSIRTWTIEDMRKLLLYVFATANRSWHRFLDQHYTRGMGHRTTANIKGKWQQLRFKWFCRMMSHVENGSFLEDSKKKKSTSVQPEKSDYLEPPRDAMISTSSYAVRGSDAGGASYYKRLQLYDLPDISLYHASRMCNQAKTLGGFVSLNTPQQYTERFGVPNAPNSEHLDKCMDIFNEVMRYLITPPQQRRKIGKYWSRGNNDRKTFLTLARRAYVQTMRVAPTMFKRHAGNDVGAPPSQDTFEKWMNTRAEQKDIESVTQGLFEKRLALKFKAELEWQRLKVARPIVGRPLPVDVDPNKYGESLPLQDLRALLKKSFRPDTVFVKYRAWEKFTRGIKCPVTVVAGIVTLAIPHGDEEFTFGNVRTVVVRARHARIASDKLNMALLRYKQAQDTMNEKKDLYKQYVSQRADVDILRHAWTSRGEAIAEYNSRKASWEEATAEYNSTKASWQEAYNGSIVKQLKDTFDKVKFVKNNFYKRKLLESRKQILDIVFRLSGGNPSHTEANYQDATIYTVNRLDSETRKMHAWRHEHVNVRRDTKMEHLPGLNGACIYVNNLSADGEGKKNQIEKKLRSEITNICSFIDDVVEGKDGTFSAFQIVCSPAKLEEDLGGVVKEVKNFWCIEYYGKLSHDADILAKLLEYTPREADIKTKCDNVRDNYVAKGMYWGDKSDSIVDSDDFFESESMSDSDANEEDIESEMFENFVLWLGGPVGLSVVKSSTSREQEQWKKALGYIFNEWRASIWEPFHAVSDVSGIRPPCTLMLRLMCGAGLTNDIEYTPSNFAFPTRTFMLPVARFYGDTGELMYLEVDLSDDNRENILPWKKRGTYDFKRDTIVAIARPKFRWKPWLDVPVSAPVQLQKPYEVLQTPEIYTDGYVGDVGSSVWNVNKLRAYGEIRMSGEVPNEVFIRRVLRYVSQDNPLKLGHGNGQKLTKKEDDLVKISRGHLRRVDVSLALGRFKQAFGDDYKRARDLYALYRFVQRAVLAEVSEGYKKKNQTGVLCLLWKYVVSPFMENDADVVQCPSAYATEIHFWRSWWMQQRGSKRQDGLYRWDSNAAMIVGELVAKMKRDNNDDVRAAFVWRFPLFEEYAETIFNPLLELTLRAFNSTTAIMQNDTPFAKLILRQYKRENTNNGVNADSKGLDRFVKEAEKKYIAAHVRRSLWVEDAELNELVLAEWLEGIKKFTVDNYLPVVNGWLSFLRGRGVANNETYTVNSEGGETHVLRAFLLERSRVPEAARNSLCRRIKAQWDPSCYAEHAPVDLFVSTLLDILVCVFSTTTISEYDSEERKGYRRTLWAEHIWRIARMALPDRLYHFVTSFLLNRDKGGDVPSWNDKFELMPEMVEISSCVMTRIEAIYVPDGGGDEQVPDGGGDGGGDEQVPDGGGDGGDADTEEIILLLGE